MLLGLPVPGGVSRKQQVHLLQRALVRLRVQRPHDGDAEEVDGGEDVEALLGQVLEHAGQQEDGPAVADAPAHDTPRVALGADLEGENLGGVQPRHREPGGAKGEGEDEHKRRGACAPLARFGRSGRGQVVEYTHKHHGNAHDYRTPVQRHAVYPSDPA